MTSSMLLEALPPVQGMAGAIDLDFSLVLAFVVLVVAMLFLKYALIDPYLGIVDERERRTAGAKEGAGDLVEQAQATLLKYESQLADARREAMELRVSLRSTGEEARESKLAVARDAAAKALADKRAQIAADLQTADAAIEHEAKDLSQALVARVLNTGA